MAGVEISTDFQDNKDFILRFIAVCFVLLLAGCETTELWTEKPGEDFIKVVPAAADEDVEIALKQTGREYYCQSLYESSYPNNKVCYTRLTSEDKIKKLQVRLFKTPESLAIDAGRTITVVGSAALKIVMSSGYYSGMEKGRPRPS